MTRKRISGPTNLDTLIILGILTTLLLAAWWTITKTLSRAQTHTQCLSCIFRARGIVAQIRAYSANWDGWTHPDPDYYVKLMGYPLKGEANYERYPTARIKDFVCPLDDEPALNGHGYPTSFEVMPNIGGRNTMQVVLPRILFLRERKELHPMPNKEGKGAVHVFADLSCKVLPIEDSGVE